MEAQGKDSEFKSVFICVHQWFNFFNSKFKIQNSKLSFLYLCVSVFILFTIANSSLAKTLTLAASKSFYKEEGAHFELILDLWEVVAELHDENNNVYYFTFSFYRSGTMYMEFRYYLAGLYDVTEKKYYHETRAPGLLAEAARRELNQKAQQKPEIPAYAAAAARIKNGEYRNFAFLTPTPSVYRNQLFIQNEAFHFKRILENWFLYSLYIPVEGKIVSLSIESLSDPIVYDSKNPIVPGTGTQLLGYAFPNMNFQGSITTGEKKIAVRGQGWYYHLWGTTSRETFTHYAILSQNLDKHAALQAMVFYNPKGLPVYSHLAFVSSGAVKHSDNSVSLKPSTKWQSAASGITYPAELGIDSNLLKGEIEILYSETEQNIIEGRGAYYLGPCRFTGTATGYKKSPTGNIEKSMEKEAGTGFCRIVENE